MDGKQNWMNDELMSLLVDYYPEVQFRPYGSGNTRKNVVPFLKQLRLGYLCIYAKGHSGYTTWPSSLKTQHNKLGQDMPRFFRDACREAGTRLVLYYSGLVDGIAGMRHPEWRMKNVDGNDQLMFQDFGSVFIGYGNCPHSEYFDEWVAVQLRELIEGYDPEGIWVDGDWPGPCYCERCRSRFRDFTGWCEPWSDLRTRPEFDAEYKRFWHGVTHAWRTRFNAFIKSLKPNCLYSAGNVCARREYLAPFDWRSGDFFSPGFFLLHDMARMMRWYGTLGVPYDAYICDTSFTHARKTVRSRTKTLERMQQEAATVAATGGSVGYWTYPLGNGAFVQSRMRKAIAVRDFLEERRDVFLHTQSAAWTAIVCPDPSAQTFGGTAIEGAHKALAALHRSPDLFDETGLTADMPHDLVVLPEQTGMDAATVARLEAYLKRGGKLLSTGASLRSPQLRRLLGVTDVRFAAAGDGHVFPRAGDEPTGIDTNWDAVTLSRGAEELYPLYLSWDSLNPELRHLPNNWPMHGQVDEENPEPAGFPAAFARRIGKGLAVHIATSVFSHYSTYGDPQILRWLREIVEFLQPEPLFATDASSWVDVSLRRKNGQWLVHLVNHSAGRDIDRLNTNDLWVDEIPTIGPIACRLRLPRRPKAVTLVPTGEPVTWTYRHGTLEMVLPRLHIHACLVVQPPGT